MPEPCDICGATRMRSFLDVSLLGTRPASVYRCDACGFRQIRPRLTAQEIKALYPSDYFDSASPIGYADYAREFQRRQREAYFLTRWLKRLGPKGRLLEVGCALGFLLAGLKRSEWHLDGVDASEFAAFYARSRYDLDVTCATLEEAAFPDDTFDVVIQKDLLEHVANPRRHLDETRRLLRPGGWLRLVTPSGEANLRPLVAVSVELGASAAVRPVLDQGHLSFFGRRQLIRLFEDCGFRCRSMRMIGIRRGLSALGRLPGQERFVRLGPSGWSTAPSDRPVAADVDTDALFPRLAERIDQDIARRHSWLRSWIPYFYYHRAMKRLDTLPAWCEVGYDFDCLLQKR
jgi:2-polyprenyl-3-methyl-5-hydroxy-6-metoxy-1,4-benzoquinol methylase